MKKKLTIGLFGFGCVGGGLYEVLNKTSLLDAHIKRIVVKNPGKTRSIPSDNFSYNKAEILHDPEINVVVELIDDAAAAYEIVTTALRLGKHVVSANKKLIALHLDELISLARENGVSFLYEAAVAASIPVIRNLEEYYNNDSLSAISGIVNGTTNYILTRTAEGIPFDVALKNAQEAGFAESDPTSDIDGFDAKYKLKILLKHAFGVSVPQEDIWNYGIRHLKGWDAQYAREKGFRIKLLAFATKSDSEVLGFVAPHLIPAEHFAYQVENEFNAVVVEALFSDKQLFLGKGAGSYPTASAVLSDISALQFDYAYEYRKSDSTADLTFTNDFELKVYVSSTRAGNLDNVPFQTISESFSGADNSYRIGTIHFGDLKKIDWNVENELFLALLPQQVLFSAQKTIYEAQTNLEPA